MQSLTLAFFVEHFRASGEGAENDAVKLCKGLAARGHTIHVIAESGEDLENIRVWHGLSDIDTHLSAIQPDLTVDWGLFHRADVHRLGGGVHGPFTQYNLLAYQGLGRWWKKMSYCKNKHQKIIAREREILTNPDALILAISNFVAEHAKSEGALPENVKVLHNSIDLQRFTPDTRMAARKEARSKWHMADDETVLLFIAHNTRLKNLALMQRILPQLQQHGKYRLLVVGKHKPAFSAPWLTWTGHLSNPIPAYAAGDILTHPTFFDSFGNIVPEALACGVPVLVSEFAGAHEILTHGKDGFILPVTGAPDHIEEEWIDTILALQNKSKVTEVTQAGYTTANTHNWPNYLDKIEQILLAKAVRQ